MPFAFFKRQSVAVALDEDLSWFSYKRLICNNVGAIYVGVSQGGHLLRNIQIIYLVSSYILVISYGIVDHAVCICFDKRWHVINCVVALRWVLRSWNRPTRCSPSSSSRPLIAFRVRTATLLMSIALCAMRLWSTEERTRHIATEMQPEITFLLHANRHVTPNLGITQPPPQNKSYRAISQLHVVREKSVESTRAKTVAEVSKNISCKVHQCKKNRYCRN